MTQSNDTQLNAIRELSDKLDHGSVEYKALIKTIAKYEHQEAQIAVHDILAYNSPKNFYALFLDELQTLKDNLNYEKRLISFVVFVYIAGCVWWVIDSFMKGPVL